MNQAPEPVDSQIELPKPVTVATLAMIILVAFSFAFVPLRSSQDEWWHLKTGQWIVQHGTLPLYDIFTYTGENLRWYNHEWLSQIVFYGAYAMGDETSLGGIRALILFKSLVVTLTFVLLAVACRVHGANWAFSCLVTLLAAEISRRTIYPRPPIFSYLLLALFLIFLYAWKTGKLRFSWLLLLGALTAVWGNLHGMVLLAIVAVGAFAGGELLEYALPLSLRKGVATDKKRWTHFVMLAGLTAAVTAAALAQPSGYHLFLLGRNFTADPLLQQIIAEMKPPPFFIQRAGDGSLVFIPGFATFWVSGLALLLLLAVHRGRFRFGADYLLVFFFLYQAVNHWRLLPLFGIAAAPAAAGLLTDLSQRLQPTARRAFQYFAASATLVLGLTYVFLIDEHGTFFQRNLRLARGESYNYVDYPKPLLDYLLRLEPPGRLFSETNYSGYFIWRLSPEHYKLFTDNRFDLFGSRFHRHERIMLAAKNAGDPDELTGEPLEKGWRELMADYGINLVVLHRSQPLHRALILDDSWKDVHYYIPQATPGQPIPAYEGWSIWLRDTPEAQESIRRAEEWLARRSGPTPAELDQLLIPPPQIKPKTAQNPVGTTDWRVPVQP